MPRQYRSIMVIVGLTFNSVAFGRCVILQSHGLEATAAHDPLAANLATVDGCPSDVRGLKTLLEADGLSVQPYMVANRGRHNPRHGSFSFFETADGDSAALGQKVEANDLYFGHFTTRSANAVRLDQRPSEGALMVELIAWDFKKELYNFYELRGTSSNPVWFYRGDSHDIVLDNQRLYLQATNEPPQFGDRMRCSACHVSGGPIMKELVAPHNDWWTADRPLPLAPNAPDQEVQAIVAELGTAEDFAKTVREGIDQLAQSLSFQSLLAARPLQERLRPLFCTTEINLISDAVPLEETKTIELAAEYFVNPLLLKGKNIVVEASDYLTATRELSFSFPETDRIDADHAWLAPVKAHADLNAIKLLLAQDLVEKEFIADVLAIDYTKPLFSSERCSLLKLVPKRHDDTWLDRFKDNLNGSGNPNAAQLSEFLTDPTKTAAYHQDRAQLYLEKVQTDILRRESFHALVRDLQDRRMEVFRADISQNPRGQILEPGFRVIFPVVSKSK